MQLRGILKGILVGLITSLIIPFLIVLIGQRGMGGITNYFGEPWLYIALLITIVPVFSYAGLYFSTRITMYNRKRWKFAIILIISVSLFAGTVGVLIGEYIVRGGMETIPVNTVLLAGIIYSSLLLPVTIPVGKFILDFLFRWIHKIPYEKFKANYFD